MKLLDHVRNMKNNFVSYRALIKEEGNYNSGMSLKEKLKGLMKGFTSEKYSLYGIEKNGFEGYLSDHQQHKTQKINGPYAVVLNDKVLFDQTLYKYQITPHFYGRIHKGTIFLEDRKATNDEFINFLDKKKALMIKKNNSAGGKGIYKLVSNGDSFQLNNEMITRDDLIEQLKTFDNHLISEYLQQADYSNKIYSRTVNTIRILVMKDPKTTEAFIPIAVHKFASNKTGPADNVWRGGLTSLVDIDTGVLQKAALHHEKNKKIEWVSHHPDSGERIEGVQVPTWGEVKETILSLTENLNFLNYIGWDVVVTKDGLRIIEGNSQSDVNILQVHKPLLEDERVKKFYKYYNILK